ncbi:hypothetical protein ACSBR1_038733 [Camellia fascicularis]
MRAEWEFRITRATVLVELCREVHIKFPQRLAMCMPIDTPQLLQKALHRIRDEVNRMTQRLQRSELWKTANEHAEDGLMDDAQQYLSWSMDAMYQDDNDNERNCFDVWRNNFSCNGFVMRMHKLSINGEFRL